MTRDEDVRNVKRDRCGSSRFTLSRFILGVAGVIWAVAEFRQE